MHLSRVKVILTVKIAGALSAKSLESTPVIITHVKRIPILVIPNIILAFITQLENSTLVL